MNNSLFLILFIALTAFMAFFPFILRKLRIPSVIALLVAGILLGQEWGSTDIIGFISLKINQLLGIPYPQTTATETASQFREFIHTLGSLGLIFLMALAGMEADFQLAKSCRKAVTFLSILTFALPAVTGFFIYQYFRPDDLPGKLLYASLFASHSVGIVFPVIRGMHLSKTRYGASILISTVITDISSIILLAVSVQMFRQTSPGSESLLESVTLSVFDRLNIQMPGGIFFPLFLGIVLLYLFLSVTIVNKISEILMKTLKPHEDMLITLMLLVIFLVVIIGEILGINSVVGAFIAGLGFSRSVQARDMMLFRKFESIGYGFLIPFLFISIGMETDLGAFAHGNDLLLIFLTITGLVASKVISGYIAMLFCHYGPRPALAAGLMTVPQLSATLAAAAIGKDLGMLDDHFFNAVIILSIVTTLPIPSLVQWVLHDRSKDKFTTIAEFEVPAVVKDDELL